jgi:hypothetical protein
LYGFTPPLAAAGVLAGHIGAEKSCEIHGGTWICNIGLVRFYAHGGITKTNKILTYPKTNKIKRRKQRNKCKYQTKRYLSNKLV